MVWTVEGGLFVAHGDCAVFHPEDDLHSVAISETQCVFATAIADGFRIHRSVSGYLESHGDFHARGIEVGVDVVVVDSGPERIAFLVADNAPFSLPVGARDSWPKPFSVGVGAIWLDGRRVFRIREGSRPKSAGTLRDAPRRWMAGPHGSALFDTDAGIWALPATGGMVFLGEFDFETCRICADGVRLLAQSEHGLVELDIGDGTLRNKKSAALWPVGFNPEPVVLDEEGGLLRTIDGKVLAKGCLPSAVATSPSAIYGPGGTAWSRKSGEQIWSHAPFCGEHLAASDDGVIQVAERIEGFDSSGNLVFNLPLPIDLELDGEISEFLWSDGWMYFSVDDGWVTVDFSGRRVGTSGPDQLESQVPLPVGGWVHNPSSMELTGPAGRFPVPVDGFVLLEDGRLFVWTEDGMGLLYDPNVGS